MPGLLSTDFIERKAFNEGNRLKGNARTEIQGDYEDFIQHILKLKRN